MELSPLQFALWLACCSRVNPYRRLFYLEAEREKERRKRHRVMVVWGGNHRLLPFHSGADSSPEPLGRGFEALGEPVRPRRAARKARRAMAASLMRERRRVSKLIHFRSFVQNLYIQLV